MTKCFITNSICYLFPYATQGLLLAFVGFEFYLDFSRLWSCLWPENAGWLTLCLSVGGWKGGYQRALSNRKTVGALSCTSGRWKSGRGPGRSHRGAQRGGGLHTEVRPELDRHTSGHGWDQQRLLLPSPGRGWELPLRSGVPFVAAADWFAVAFALGSPSYKQTTVVGLWKMGYYVYCRKFIFSPQKGKNLNRIIHFRSNCLVLFLLLSSFLVVLLCPLPYSGNLWDFLICSCNARNPVLEAFCMWWSLPLLS